MLYIKVVMKIMFIIKKNYKPKWSEGFSAKKKCLVEVGLYPNIGIDGGNDNLLSESLEKNLMLKEILIQLCIIELLRL